MLTAIVKPTHDCNLACKYCYVDNEAETGRMDDNTLKNTIEKVTLYSENVKDEGKEETHFIWHGGEPLLMGLEFFKKIVEIEKKLKKRGHKITNGIQTNATLITDEFLNFVENENDFHISFSIDGPECLHNQVRMYPDGRGSFSDVMQGVHLIKRRSNPKIGGGSIAIVTKNNIDKIKEIYDFYKSERIHLKLNPLIKSGNAIKSYNELAITPKEFGKAMCQLFDEWFYDKKTEIDVDPFDIIMGNILTEIPFGCNYGVTCQKDFISIGPTGVVYPCGKFDGKKEFYLGNINEHTMEELDNHPLRLKLRKRADEVKGCEPCNYRKICNSGCMHNAYIKTGDPMKKDYYCSGEKMLFKHIENAVNLELDKATVREVG